MCLQEIRSAIDNEGTLAPHTDPGAVPSLEEYRSAPNEDMVRVCRELLDLAESGELRALQWVGATTGGEVQTYVVGEWASPLQLLGACAMLRLHVEAKALESVRDEG